MAKNREAEACDRLGFNSKNNLTGSEINSFTASNYNGKLEPIQSILERMIGPGKVVRCYRCLACDRSYAVSRMSNLLIICRECWRTTQSKGPIAQGNQIERIKAKIGALLRARLGTV